VALRPPCGSFRHPLAMRGVEPRVEDPPSSGAPGPTSPLPLPTGADSLPASGRTCQEVGNDQTDQPEPHLGGRLGTRRSLRPTLQTEAARKSSQRRQLVSEQPAASLPGIECALQN
jgi:hypothetical protein